MVLAAALGLEPRTPTFRVWCATNCTTRQSAKSYRLCLGRASGGRGGCEKVQKCDCGFDAAVAALTVVRGRPRRGSGQTRNAKEYRVFKNESFRERCGEDFGGRALFR